MASASPLQIKVKAIKNAEMPRNMVELREYLGLLNYFSRFILSLSITLK